MIGSYTFKYDGVLKNFSLDKINRETFPLLIEANIFDIKELSRTYESVEDYFGIELDDSSWAICDFYLYNRKEYHLKKEVLEDMFDRCELRLEEYSDVEEKINSIEFNLTFEVSDLSKIRLLKKQISELCQSLKDPTYYLLYDKNLKTNGFKNWYIFFTSEQIDNENYQHIFNYLTGEKDFIPNFIKDIWQDYFYVKKLSDFCKQKISQLEQISGIKESDVIITNPLIVSELSISGSLTSEEKIKNEEFVRNDIFNDGGEEVFKYIISRYQQKKSRAFFSYLYFYLKGVDKIISTLGNDSLEYRKYVIENFNVKSFSKIQKTESENSSSKKSRLEILFTKYCKDFLTVEKKKNI